MSYYNFYELTSPESASGQMFRAHLLSSTPLLSIRQ